MKIVSKKYGLLSISVHCYFKINKLFYVLTLHVAIFTFVVFEDISLKRLCHKLIKVYLLNFNFLVRTLFYLWSRNSAVLLYC